MLLDFFKYQAAGNDFVLIDNRMNKFDRADTTTVEKLCNRKFGIGSDGLILLQNSPEADFEMVYYNSDGYEASMCGNGGRCIVAFAKQLGIIDTVTSFLAADGRHEAIMLAPNLIRLKMIDVLTIEKGPDYYYMNTGTPHYVKFVENIDSIDVYTEGRKIRYNERFKETGTNVNFVERKGDILLVRTYERGVENETLACGTGITASAIASGVHHNMNLNAFTIKALGGNLRVSFDPIFNGSVENIWLEGPAEKVFEGKITI
jgi:diaminopimelate epimerase